jgi:hypothetical protein
VLKWAWDHPKIFILVLGLHPGSTQPREYNWGATW